MGNFNTYHTIDDRILTNGNQKRLNVATTDEEMQEVFTKEFK